jgi:DNA-binding NtrC family response regulator
VAESTVTEHASQAGGAQYREARLGVVLVHMRGPVEPRAYEVAESATVGREPTTEIPVDDAGVSRAHARFDQRGSALWVQDLGSRNGTYLNGERLPDSGAFASVGSVVRVGRTLLVVTDVAPYAEQRPAPLAGLLGGASLDDARFCIETIAATKSPVLILGETGTGKEVVSRLVHEVSGRRGPFVALNCAAVPSELVDAELFGHTRGAFSGATNSRTGLFRAADGGTLFLDEIGEMPAAVQAKLLRTLETEEVRPVGEDRAVNVDVRVVAATNREVDHLIESGSFRGDLLHRLAGLRIVLPPLRARVEDVPLLAEHFASGSGVGLSTLALERLIAHSWPGNVRELRNLITSGVEVARRKQHAEVEVDDVAGMFAPRRQSGAPASEDDALMARITEALTATSGDVAAAADRLGTSRSVLYETLRRLKIEPRVYRRR